MSELFCYARFNCDAAVTLTCALDGHPDGTDHFDAVRHLWWRAASSDVEFDLNTGWLTERGTAGMPARMIRADYDQRTVPHG
jgi:hypothetical protein